MDLLLLFLFLGALSIAIQGFWVVAVAVFVGYVLFGE
jgi:hypothetical protein